MKSIPYVEFEMDLRQAVLDALDAHIRGIAQRPSVKTDRGWEDRDLPELFKSVDTHARVLAKRINANPDAFQIYIPDVGEKP